MTTTFRIASIASGMGMHLHGLKQIGGVTSWAIECDEAIANCYRQNHDGEVYVQRVEDIDPTQLAETDLLITTLSCKNASVSKGANRGEKPEDIAAGKAVARIIQAKRPKWFMLENVWGYRNFKAFESIKRSLDELGYHVWFDKLNLKNWAAQSRERLYLLASRDSSFPDFVPPQREPMGWYEAIADLIDQLPETTLAPWQQKKFPQLVEAVESCLIKDHNSGRALIIPPEDAASTVLSTCQSFRALVVDKNESCLIPDHGNWTPVVSAEDPAFTVRAGHQTLKALIKRAGGGRKNDRLYLDEPAFTIRAMGRKCDNHSQAANAVVGSKIVAVTAKACLRFFGDKETADKIRLPPTKSLANEVVGNGASWVVFRELFEHMAGVSGQWPVVSSQSSVDTQRHHLDFYESPSWFTTELLRHVKIEGVIGEPCVGSGAIASLLQAWPHTTSLWTNDIDLNKQADYHYDATDSKSWGQFPKTDWIITNPPYADKAAPIIKNAFEKARVGVVAFLLTSFLEPCADRDEFLKQHPPSLVLTLPRYCFRKDKSGKRWTTDNSTISCFVWDKRATSQRLISRPQSEIVGFYKNPDKAISQQEAEGIVRAIASGEISTNYFMETTAWNPAHFGDVTHEVEDDGQLTIFYEGIQELPDPDDFSNIAEYEQAWQQWEANQSNQNINEGNKLMTFQFSEASRIFQQIQALQEQLNQLTASIAPYKECEQQANTILQDVRQHADLMRSKGISSNGILDWSKSLYEAASGSQINLGGSAAIAAQNEEIAKLKSELAEVKKRNEHLAGESIKIAGNLKMAQDQAQVKEEAIAQLQQEIEQIKKDSTEEESVTFIWDIKNQRVIDDIEGLSDKAVEQLIDAQSASDQQEYDYPSLFKGTIVQREDGQVGKVEYVPDPFKGIVSVKFLDGSFNYQAKNLKVVSQSESPDIAAQKRGREFIESIRSKALMNAVTWSKVSEVCQRNSHTFREIELSATTKNQKELVEKLPELMADYIAETGDRSDFEWLGETFKSKVEGLLETRKLVSA